MIGANSHTHSGRLTCDPEVDVIHREGESGLTVVIINIVYDHPHDLKKHWTNRRPQYMKIRLYGKTAAVSYTHLTLPTNREV